MEMLATAAQVVTQTVRVEHLLTQGEVASTPMKLEMARQKVMLSLKKEKMRRREEKERRKRLAEEHKSVHDALWRNGKGTNGQWSIELAHPGSNVGGVKDSMDALNSIVARLPRVHSQLKKHATPAQDLGNIKRSTMLDAFLAKPSSFEFGSLAVRRRTRSLSPELATRASPVASTVNPCATSLSPDSLVFAHLPIVSPRSPPERTTGSPIDSDASTLQSVEDRECLDELQGEGGNVKSPLFFSPVDPDASTLPSLDHRKRLDELQCVMGNVKDPLRQHEIADSHDRPPRNELDMLPTPRRLSKRKMSDCASVNPGLSAHLHGVDGRCRLEPITSRQPVTNRQKLFCRGRVIQPRVLSKPVPDLYLQ